MRTFAYTMLIAIGAFVVAAEAAFAGPSPATPGAIAAVGAPSLLVLAGAFMAVRRLRARRK